MNVWEFRGWEFGFWGHLVQKEFVETDREILRYVLYVRFSRPCEGVPLGAGGGVPLVLAGEFPRQLLFGPARQFFHDLC